MTLSFTGVALGLGMDAGVWLGTAEAAEAEQLGGGGGGMLAKEPGVKRSAMISRFSILGSRLRVRSSSHLIHLLGWGVVPVGVVERGDSWTHASKNPIVICRRSSSRALMKAFKPWAC